MATQRIAIATIAGQAAIAIAGHFTRWRNSPAPGTALEIDRLCHTLRAHSASPPIVFFCEWIDPWSMGDRIPGPSKVQGTAFQASCLTRIEALAWADSCGSEHPEDEWLAARFREAASVWCGEADRVAILAIREVLGPSITDEEVLASLTIVPPWLFGD